MNRRQKYFKILGIEPTTDQAKIKRAYRKKALAFHPDRYDAPDAEIRFIEVNEAYEFLSDQRPQAQPPAGPRVKTAEEIRQEKIKRARERFKDLKNREEQEDAAYFNEITSGTKWRYFKIGAIYSFILGLMLVTDFLLERESIMVKNPEQFSIIQRAIGVDNETFLVNNQQYWASKFRPIKVNKSFFFRDTKSITLLLNIPEGSDPSIPQSRNNQFQFYDAFPQAEFYARGTVYHLFPFPQLFLMVPFLLIFLKRPNFRFSLWRIISIWAIFPFALILTFWQGRIFYLFGLF